MLNEQVRLWLIIIVITVLSGIGDSQGFVHAAKIWVNDKLDWSELGKSALGFAVPMSKPRYTCRESAEMMAAPNCPASLRASAICAQCRVSCSST